MKHVVIKEEFFADGSESRLKTVAMTDTFEQAEAVCIQACQQECNELNESQDINTPPEGCDETCLPDGFRWEDGADYEPDNESPKFQYVVLLWTGDDSRLVSGFAILELNEDTSVNATMAKTDEHPPMTLAEFCSMVSLSPRARRIPVLPLYGRYEDGKTRFIDWFLPTLGFDHSKHANQELEQRTVLGFLTSNSSFGVEIDMR